MDYNFLTLYRVQADKQDTNPYLNRNLPMKRVIVSSVGKIEFNPDAKQYIYFSRSQKHHIYYIFNKVLKIIVDELKNAKAQPIFKYLDIPEDLTNYNLYKCSDHKILRRVQNFFKNYLPQTDVELVTLKYLNSFGKVLDKCIENNKSKQYESFAPEYSDRTTYGGAYGINDAWLNLLKSCIYSTELTNLSIDKFFDFMIENSYQTVAARARLKTVLNTNSQFFKILNYVTYRELKNPAFFDKNNVNNMIFAIESIMDKKLYAADGSVLSSDFKEAKKEIKKEIEELRR